MHVGGTVSRARHAVADAQEGSFGVSVESRELDDLLGRHAAQARRPLGRARLEMRLERFGHVGVAGEIFAIGESLGEQHMHDAAGEGAVGAGARHEMNVSLLGRAGAIRIHHHQLRTALALGLRDVVHDVDLGVDRIGAPHDDEIALGHLPRIDPALGAGAGDPAGVHQRDAECGVLARIALHVTQPFDAVALHEPHGAGVEVGPYGLTAVALLRLQEFLGHLVERVVPGKRLEGGDADALGAASAQRLAQPVRVVHAFCVARHLRADHTRGVVIVLCAVDPADGVRVDTLHLQRAGARAVVGTGGVDAGNSAGSGHGSFASWVRAVRHSASIGRRSPVGSAARVGAAR